MTTAELDFDELLNNEVASDEPKKNAAETKDSETINRYRAKPPVGLMVFDIETIPDYSREHLFALPELPEIGPRTTADKLMAIETLLSASLEEIKQVLRTQRPSNDYLMQMEAAEKASKKPRKGLFDAVEELMGEAKQLESARDERRKKMATSPEMCRIVSIGWALGSDPIEARAFRAGNTTTDHDTYERAVLKKFWQIAKTSKVLVGFNHVAFDLPVIYVRSAMLGVEPTRRIDTKPWGGEVVDLMASRWPKGSPMKLKDFARSLGLAVPAEGVDGSQVEELLNSNPDKLAEYNRSDVAITRELFLMYRGFFW